MQKQEYKFGKLVKLDSAESIVKELQKFQYLDEDRKPVTIIGPAGGDTNLRVYAYGGCIGEIATTKKKQCKLAFSKDKNGKYSYGKYLEDGYVNKHDIKFDYQSVPELQRVRELIGKPLPDAFHSLAISDDEKEEKLVDSNYLNLVISAAYTRFMHREKGKSPVLSERSKQTLMAKQSQSVEWNAKKEQMVVIDVECDIPLHFKNPDGSDKRKKYSQKQKKYVDKKKAKVDFVVFDGKSFGLIEFKYRGASMEDGTNNSLREHYKDFRRIISEDDNAHKITLIKELIRRMEYLIVYGIIDEQWKTPLQQMWDSIENMQPEQYKDSYLWCGFCFVGGNENTIIDKITKQICDEGQNDNIKVKYQIAQDCTQNTICMSDKY